MDQTCYTLWLLDVNWCHFQFILQKSVSFFYIGLVTGYNHTLLQYYPEMNIDLGKPFQNVLIVEDYYDESTNLYEREFSNGLVLVNPFTDTTLRQLEQSLYHAVPEGGGVVNDDGTYGTTANLSFQLVNEVVVPAQSGVVLVIYHTAIEDENVNTTFLLDKNYPNPFERETMLLFALKTPGQTRLDIYNICGRCVDTHLDEMLPAGEHNITWQPCDFATNIYFARLTAPNGVRTTRLLLK